jgi:DNA-directed RNA polymerase specialized sigma24 family protein
MERVQEAPVRPAARLERVYREEGDRMWRAVLAFAGDTEVAADSVAEAFAQALRRGEAIRDPGRWVWRAAFRIAAGELKRRRSTTEPGQWQGWAALDTEAMELIDMLKRLPPKQRAALALHHGAGYPVREVASIIGSTSAAVRVHLSRGRRRLRELMGGDE